MRNVFRRSMSLLLALVTVVSLMPMVKLQTEAASENPYPDQTITIANVPDKEKSPASYSGPAKTYADVWEIVNDYYDCVNKKYTDRAYWNVGIRNDSECKTIMTSLKNQYSSLLSDAKTTENKKYMKSLPFYATITSQACKKKNGHNFDTYKLNGCSSNKFGASVATENGTQCLGFTEYMAYVVFKDKVNQYKKLTGSDAKKYANEGNIKPGDILKIKSHFVFVYEVTKDAVYVINCNGDESCGITTRIYGKGGGSRTITFLKDNLNAVYKSPAVPSLDQYTIAYDANKPSGTKVTGTMASQKVSVGSAANLKDNTYKIDGYVFNGWNTRKDGKGTSYKNKASVTDLAKEDGATVTLYAQWISKAANDYLNTSTSYASSLRAKVVRVELIQNMKSLPCSWATSTESKTIRALKTDETLTVLELRKNAQGNYWYKVKADSDGAEGYVYHEHIEVWSENNVSFNVKLAKYSITKGNGCQISGSVSSKHGLTYLEGFLDDSDPSVTLDTQRITSGYGKIEDTAIDDNLPFGELSRGKGTLTLTAEMKNNYRYDAGKKTHVRVTETKVIDFVVVGQYNVKFNANTTDSVGNMPATQKKTDGKNITLSSAVPTRSGYTFKGWSTDKNATKETYKAGATLAEDTDTGDMTLYAVWAKGTVTTYSVTYDANGGSGAPGAQSKEKGKSLTLSGTVPTRSGYSFLGWAKNKSAAKPDYAKGKTHTYSTDANLTLYAVWEKVAVYDMKYVANGTGVTNMPANDQKIKDQKYTVSSVIPKRTGYVFQNWNVKADPAWNDPAIDPGDEYLVNQAVNFYAQWEPIEYEINYDPNGGSYLILKMFNTNHTYDEAKKLNSNNYWKSGYEFNGWNTKADGSGKSYKDEESVKNLSSTDGSTVTLYAQWKKNGEEPKETQPATKETTPKATEPPKDTTPETTTQTVVIPNVDRSQKNPGSYTAAKTYADVEAIVMDYWKTVTDYGKNKVYWNKKISSETMKVTSFSDTITTGQCKIESGKSHNKNGGCTSNLFKGIGNVNDYGELSYFNDIQCSAFTAYMTYVVFKEVKRDSDWTVYYKTDLPKDYIVKPGDQIRTHWDWLTSESAGHSRFIYKVENGTAYYIECNFGGKCRINQGSVSVEKIISTVRNTNGAFLISAPTVPSVKTYNIKFDSNKPSGAKNPTGTMENQKAFLGASTVLNANRFAIEGYVFDGWNTKKDGKGTTIKDKGSVTDLTTTENATATLYAVWKKADASAEAEQYMAKCTAYFSAGTLKITSGSAWFKALPCSESTCKASANVHSSAVPKGTEMTVTGIYKNSEGNYWYKATWNGKTGYIYAAQGSFTAAAADFTISGESKPGTLKKGAGFGLKGTVTSKIGSPFKITGTISDTGGQRDSQTVTSNSASYSLATKEFDNNISFGQLASGSCKYTVTASVTCYYSTNGTKLESKELSKTLIDHTFQVSGGHTMTFVSGHDDNKTVKTLTVQDNGTFTIPDIGYQRDGYKFLGYTVMRLKDSKVYGGGKWQTEKELTNSGKDPQLYVVGRNLTLNNTWTTGGVTDSNYRFTGVWEAVPTYTVTYNANGGSGAPAAQTMTTDKTLTLSTTEPTRTGYTFLGWAKSNTATKADYVKGASYTAKESVTLYAVWKAEQDAAFLVDNLGDTNWVLKNGTVTEAENADTAGLSHVEITFRLSENLRQKYPDLAEWAKNNPVYVTEFEIPLQMQDLKLAFQVADGTYDLVIRSSDSYVEQYTCSVRVSGDTQLQVDLYELILNFNGGKIPVGNEEAEQVTSYYIYENYDSFAGAFAQLPTREGYTLIGWDSDANALRPDYDPYFYVHLFFRGDLELYAIWQDQSADNAVYLVDNNGENPICWAIREDGITETEMVDVSRLNHVVLTLNPSEIIRQQYPDLSLLPEMQNGVDVNGEIHLNFVDQKLDFYVSDSELNYIFPTLGSQWFEITKDREIQLDLCQVVLNFNGGTWSDGTQGFGMIYHAVSGKQRSYTSSARGPVREGYVLLGWASSPDATEAEYNTKFFASFDTDTMLYAVWQKEAPTLTYATDLPATNLPSRQSFEVGEQITLSDQIPVSDGFVFKGWSANIGGDSVVFQPGDTVSFDESVTLWALWEIAPICVYDVNGDKYWQINQYTYEVTVVPYLDTSDLAHITITLNPSEGVRDKCVDIQQFYDDYDFCIGPLGPGEGYFQIQDNKFDFYVSKGTYYHCRNGANGANHFDFQESQDLVFDIYVLRFVASYDDYSDVSNGLIIGNYPYSGEMGQYPERDGYTLIGWSKTPNATTPDYPVVFPWEFDADTTIYAVWEKNS